jgi:hypothetical protein
MHSFCTVSCDNKFSSFSHFTFCDFTSSSPFQALAMEFHTHSSQTKWVMVSELSIEGTKEFEEGLLNPYFRVELH